MWSGLYSFTHSTVERTTEHLPTLTADQVTRLVNWKPKPRHFYQRRLHLLTLLLLDTGCRITEAPTLRVRDLDMDNMLITLDGKGRKQRRSNPVVLRGVQLTGCALTLRGRDQPRRTVYPRSRKPCLGFRHLGWYPVPAKPGSAWRGVTKSRVFFELKTWDSS